MTDDTVRAEPIDTEVLPADVREDLEEGGYTGRYEILDGGQVHCLTCDHDHDPAEVTITAIHRYEGQTDPGDEESVMALICPCGCEGTVTTPAGAYADSAIGDAVRQMADGRQHGQAPTTT